MMRRHRNSAMRPPLFGRALLPHTLLVLWVGLVGPGHARADGETPERPMALLSLATNASLPGAGFSIASNTVAWQVFGADRVTRHAIADVSTIDVANEDPVAGRAELDVLHMTNGDRLRGHVVDVQPSRVVLATDYAGRLHVDRRMVHRFEWRRRSDETLYRGPNAMEEWIVLGPDRGAWRYEQGELISSRPISLARRMAFPEVTRLDFTAYSPEPLLFRVNLRGSRLDPSLANGYFLMVSHQTLRFGRASPSNRATMLGSAITHAFSPGARTRFTVILDREQGEISLLVDGVLKHTWSDPEADEGLGDALLFTPTSSAPLHLSDIRVSVWNADIPSLPELEPDDPNDVVQLINGDVAIGRLERIENGTAVLRTRYTEARLPIARIAQIHSALADARRQRLWTEDVRVRVRGGSVMIVRLDRVNDGLLSGTSEAYGAVHLRVDQLERIAFNLYESFDAPWFSEFVR